MQAIEKRYILEAFRLEPKDLIEIFRTMTRFTLINNKNRASSRYSDNFILISVERFNRLYNSIERLDNEKYLETPFDLEKDKP
jgi:hypothetical protein